MVRQVYFIEEVHGCFEFWESLRVLHWSDSCPELCPGRVRMAEKSKSAGFGDDHIWVPASWPPHPKQDVGGRGSFKWSGTQANPLADPVAHKMFSKSWSCQAIVKGKPLFCPLLGWGPQGPPGVKLCWVPLTKILDPPQQPELATLSLSLIVEWKLNSTPATDGKFFCTIPHFESTMLRGLHSETSFRLGRWLLRESLWEVLVLNKTDGYLDTDCVKSDRQWLR